jgi:hypothetical protein
LKTISYCPKYHHFSETGLMELKPAANTDEYVNSAVKRPVQVTTAVIGEKWWSY